MNTHLISDMRWILPDWPAPASVRAVSTTRRNGVSSAPWDGFNLAAHVGDAQASVDKNRADLVAALELPSAPNWLQQVHGCGVVGGDWSPGIEGDAAFARANGVVCAVMTADCLPVLLCDSAGTQVAACHAGWRGLAAGVIEQTLEHFSGDRSDIIAWLGPAIGPQAFEVGDEVYDAFVGADGRARDAFVRRADRWLADLYALARLRLQNAGVRCLFGGDCCTYQDAERFFSYRRDGVTGRMATLIWLAPETAV